MTPPWLERSYALTMQDCFFKRLSFYGIWNPSLRVGPPQSTLLVSILMIMMRAYAAHSYHICLSLCFLLFIFSMLLLFRRWADWLLLWMFYSGVYVISSINTSNEVQNSIQFIFYGQGKLHSKSQKTWMSRAFKNPFSFAAALREIFCSLMVYSRKASLDLWVCTGFRLPRHSIRSMELT